MRRVVLLVVAVMVCWMMAGCGDNEEKAAHRGGFPDVPTYRDAKIQNITNYAKYKKFLADEEKREKAKLAAENTANFLLKWQDDINKGSEITQRLLAKPRNTIQIPFTPDDMVLNLYVSSNDWVVLSQKEKEQVCLYVKSIIVDAKSAPEQYAMIEESAPIFARYISAARNICLDCWGVMSTDLSPLVTGDEVYYRGGAKPYLTSFSVFSSNAYGTEMFQGDDTRGTSPLAAMKPSVNTVETDLTHKAVTDYLTKNYNGSSVIDLSRVSKTTRGGKEFWLCKARFSFNGAQYFGDFYVAKWSDSMFKVENASIRQH